jgi:hypothetical protein
VLADGVGSSRSVSRPGGISHAGLNASQLLFRLDNLAMHAGQFTQQFLTTSLQDSLHGYLSSQRGWIEGRCRSYPLLRLFVPSTRRRLSFIPIWLMLLPIGPDVTVLLPGTETQRGGYYPAATRAALTPAGRPGRLTTSRC